MNSKNLTLYILAIMLVAIIAAIGYFCNWNSYEFWGKICSGIMTFTLLLDFMAIQGLLNRTLTGNIIQKSGLFLLSAVAIVFSII